MDDKALSFGLTIDEDACNKCSLCVYSCPFEAISVRRIDGKHRIEVEEDKCRLCGLCYSVCPSRAIKIAYYGLEELFEQARKLCVNTGERSLAIACRGSNPTDVIIVNRIGSEMPLISIPCVGRIPLEFYVKLLAGGVVEKLYLLPCEEGFCRLKEGGKISFLRLNHALGILEGIGADGKSMSVIKSVNRAKVNEQRCIGCGNCAHYCPYEAVGIKSPGIASIDEEKCRGCGICLAHCPSFAITLEGYEHERLSEILSKVAEKAKTAGGAEPPIAVFYCQWAYIPKPPRNGGAGICFIELPCAGRVDPLHVIQALNLGFRGVLILACRQDACSFNEAGARRAEEDVKSLKRLLSQLKLEERVNIAFVSQNYPGEADEAISSFISKNFSQRWKHDSGEA
ncbi:MAG: 4Fe-4S binding protein [Thermoproteota archaeon]